MSYGVTVFERPERSRTNDGIKLFKWAMAQAITDSDEHDPQMHKFSAARLIAELIRERNPAVIKAYVEMSDGFTEKLKHAQLDKVRTETDLAERKHNEESTIRGLQAQKLRKEIEGNVVDEIDVGLNNPTLAKMLALTENKTRNKKKKS